MIKELFEKDILLPIDLMFADSCVRMADENLRLFLAVLFSTARNGHLCLKIGNKIAPSLYPGIEEKLNDGALQVPEKLLSRPKDIREPVDKPLVVFHNHFYLQKYWLAETEIYRELLTLIPQKSHMQALPVDTGLNSAQQEAVEKGLAASFFILTGGPGTGKTYTASQIVKRWKGKGTIWAVAPTGKAASHLKSSLKNTGEIINSGTLHSLLQIGKRNATLRFGGKLNVDFLIVDECSMIDVSLWAHLLRAIGENTKVLLLGDADQLPPVEAGTIFEEIARLFQAKAPWGITHLEKSVRTKRADLLKISTSIRNGYFDGLDRMHREGISISELLHLCPGAGPSFHLPSNESLYEEMGTFRLLSSMRKGPFGTKALNEAFFMHFQKQFCEGMQWPIPILITRTSHARNLYNGEMGYLICHSGRGRLDKRDYALIPEKGKVPVSFLPPYEFAYALSIHKSQGSEYDKVVLLFPEGSERFGREILYTGITRAKNEVLLIAKEQTLQNILATKGSKSSSFLLFSEG